ncbi:CBS domain-containing protein [Lyngbya confervoides]|uniref:CBS domain-containing protein n=1 Tax=Lyngbya confervoides BDU141951 TaxID=1574623 RepID=A0ABD4T1R2_9CYAN|nr:CBS domain-containing protein [Lyngbya confervoides]MCM1982584.1 CBS domain-containing protein [Lyngbya confervoides BDU141951]
MMSTDAKVKDFMTPSPITIAPAATVEEAVKLMEEKGISGLPVADESGKLVGIISEGDLLVRESPMKPPLFLSLLGGVIYFESPSQFHQHIKKSLGMLVSDVMTDKVITVMPEQSLSEASNTMLSKKVNRLPVVDDQKRLVGILTRHDLVRALKGNLS